MPRFSYTSEDVSGTRWRKLPKFVDGATYYMKNYPHASRTPDRNRRHWIIRNGMTALTLAIVIAYAGFIEWAFGWTRVVALWQKAGLELAALALVALLATHVLRAWRIRDYFGQEIAGRFGRLFRLTQVHNLLNIMLPFRTGEVSFPMLMKQEFDVGIARGACALLAMRLFDLHALVAAAGLGLVLADPRWVMWALWLAFLILPALGFALRKPVFRLASKFVPVKLEKFVSQIEEGLPADAKAFARAWAATLINWFTKIAVLAFVLSLMGGLTLTAGFGGALGGELSSVLPFHAPAGVGTYPAAIAAGSLAFGAESSASALEVLGAAAVNTHLLIVVSSLVGTALSLLFGQSPNDY